MKHLGLFKYCKKELKVGTHYLVYGRYLRNIYGEPSETYFGLTLYDGNTKFKEYFAYQQTDSELFGLSFRKCSNDGEYGEYRYSDRDEIFELTDEEASVILMVELENEETGFY